MGGGASRVTSHFDVGESAFLGTGDKYNTYLVYFYDNGLSGDEDQKFEFFKELYFNNDGLREFFEEEGLELPCSSSGMKD